MPNTENVPADQGSTLTMAMLNDMIARVAAMPKMPDRIMVSRPHAAMLKANIDFQHRDRRRIKREMNKAYKKARALDIRDGVPRHMSEHSYSFNLPRLNFGVQPERRAWNSWLDMRGIQVRPMFTTDTVS